MAYTPPITDITATGNITTQNLVPAGTATAGSAVQTATLNAMASASVQVTGTYTGALSAQVMVDNTNWVTLGGTPFLNSATGVFSATIASATVGIFQLDVAAFTQFRITGLAAMTGTAVATIRCSNGVGMVALDASLPTGTNTIGAVNIAASQTLSTVTTVGTVTNITNQGNLVDNTAFTPATSRIMVAGFEVDEISTVVATEGSAGSARMTVDRKQIVTPYAHTSGGATPFKLVSAATTNATSVKATAGQVYMITASNVNASPRYLKLYNLTVAPTVGTSVPVLTFIIPGNTTGAGTNIPVPACGITFSAGISIALTTEATDAGTTAVAVSEIVVNLGYL